MQLMIKNSIAMGELGKKIAQATILGTVIYLEGELGAGKTTLVRGFMRALGYLKPVRSPTFNLFEIYNLKDKIIVHFDLYRLINPDELIYIGIEEYFNLDTICLVEWPKRGGKYLPRADLECNFSFGDLGVTRRVAINPFSIKGAAIIENLKKNETKL